MVCPHCGKEIEGTVLRPARYKDLHITSWCTLCGKAKGFSGTLLMGSTGEEGVEAPPQCMCGMYSSTSTTTWLPNMVSSGSW